MRGAWSLIDERSRPTLRERLGRQLVGAESADFAVARIRLAALDLTEREIGGSGRWRVLLGELDAAMLLEASEGVRAGPPTGTLGRLRAFAGSGRLEVRSAGLGSWTPDFAIVRRRPHDVCVAGAIYFGQPRLVMGPSLTVLTRDRAAVRELSLRFEELWERSHDVLPAILEVLERADAVALGTAAGSGGGAAGRALRRPG